MPDPLTDLISLSRRLGDPALDAVILGEGNTSAKVDGATFWVKGSGSQLATMQAEHFVHLRFDRILALFDRPQVSEAELVAAYESAKVDPSVKRRPSVETLFHAALLQLPGVGFVAHSHATAVNCLTCSKGFPDVLAGRMFPDEAVVLGPEAVFVPYIDPGVELARRVRDEVEAFRRARGVVPKTVYMQNHGLIAIAGNADEAINITMMAIKAARIRLGALAAGGISLLPGSVVGHLLSRPDEKYRQEQLGLRV
jgi:rhamnose utilization protein RhaD (predicted bifunctional aldolase and dehydrogenase)